MRKPQLHTLTDADLDLDVFVAGGIVALEIMLARYAGFDAYLRELDHGA